MDRDFPTVPNGAPPDFRHHAFEREFVTPHPVEDVWGWLNDPATFVDGQVWPFKVEFVGGGFEPGVLNVHHGPLMNFAGVIGEVTPPKGDEPGYRDLPYFYGSFAISPRLVRPTRLQFWVRRARAGTAVRLRVDSLVHPRFVTFWDRGQGVFWKRFPKWMDTSLGG